MYHKKARAFTLIEMMAVVVIIGLLAAVIGPKLFKPVEEAKVTTAKQEINTIGQQITLYQFQTGKFPEDLGDLRKDPDIKGWKGPYLDKKAVDPWDNKYQYRVPGEDGREFEVWSYGSDGKEGGDSGGEDVLGWEVDE